MNGIFSAQVTRIACLVSTLGATVIFPQITRFIYYFNIQMKSDSIYPQNDTSRNQLAEIRGQRKMLRTNCMLSISQIISLSAHNNLARQELLPPFCKCEDAHTHVTGFVWMHTASLGRAGGSCRPGSPGACVTSPPHATSLGTMHPTALYTLPNGRVLFSVFNI